MDILDAIAIEFPCRACGNPYEVSLKQIMLSQDMLHEGCPVSDERECPPMFYADVVDRDLIDELQRAWVRLEERARAGGGRLLLWTAQGK